VSFNRDRRDVFWPKGRHMGSENRHVNIQKTMGNHHFWWVNPLQNLQMAIFNSHVCLPEGIISFCYGIAILRYTLFSDTPTCSFNHLLKYAYTNRCPRL
jgi:hypothetical protein